MKEFPVLLWGRKSRREFIKIGLGTAALSAVAVTGLGVRATHLATVLGVTPMAILRGIDPGHDYLRARHLDPDRLAREALGKR